MPITVHQLLANPDYYPLRFADDNLQFIRMTRGSYAASIFTLPGRIVRTDNEVLSIPLAQLLPAIEAVEQTAPSPAVIFQIAHCGSTLLSRALDHDGRTLVIREPFALRQLLATAAAPDPASITARSRLLKALWALYSRRYSTSERVLIKANVPVNLALQELQSELPAIPGVLLYSDYEDYVLAVLKSDERRQWARHVAQELQAGVISNPAISHSNLTVRDLAQLDGAQAATLLWLAQIDNYAHAARQQPGLRSLNSENLYQQPLATMTACASWMGLDIADADLRTAVDGALFKQHAKSPEQAYDPQTRARDVAELRSRYSAELQQVREWADNLSLDLTASLQNSALELPTAQ